MKQPYVLLAYLGAFRIANALICRTAFLPDEFFQSVEIAHKLVFGYGWQTWEWQPEAALRSPLHALLFVPGYWIVKVSELEFTDALVAAPKITQGIVAAINDFFTFKLACRLFGDERHANVALFCSLASFYNAGATIRTFSNSAETALTAAAMSLWPWRGHTGSFAPPMAIAGLTCVLRPTSAITWLLLAATILPRGRRLTKRMMRETVWPAMICTGLCLTVDTWYYQRLTFTPWNFFRINIFDHLALFFGSDAWHFYITSALPVLLLSMLPFALHGTTIIIQADKSQPILHAILVAFANIAVFSTVSHKEWRFLQPLLPTMHCAVAQSLLTLSEGASKEDCYPWVPAIRKKYIRFILVVNLPAVWFFLLHHQRSQVSLANYVRNVPNGEMRSLGFLMGCHSTPWQSHMHRPELETEGRRSGYGGRLWGITCDPPTQ